jgi:formylglycine-generating enzyme required for sulfatase activity
MSAGFSTQTGPDGAFVLDGSVGVVRNAAPVRGRMSAQIRNNRLYVSLGNTATPVAVSIITLNGEHIPLSSITGAHSLYAFGLPQGGMTNSAAVIRFSIDNAVYTSRIVRIDNMCVISGVPQTNRDAVPRGKIAAAVDTIVFTKEGYAEKKIGLESTDVDLRVVTLDPEGKAGMMDQFVFIEAKGKSFMMGSENGQPNEQPVTKVNFTYNYWVCDHEVLQGEFKEVLGDEFTGEGANRYPWEAYKFKKGWGEIDDNHPMWYINWFDCAYFCNELSKKYGLEPVYSYTSYERNQYARGSMSGVKRDYSKNGFRLLTEAEWEYMARAGTTTKYYWGDSDENIGEYAHFGNSSLKTVTRTAKKPNAWGIYNTAGNCSEWCTDIYDEYPGGEVTNPTGKDGSMGEKTLMVQRGGSWRHRTSDLMTVTIRAGLAAVQRHHAVGVTYPGNDYERPGMRIGRGVVE